MPKSSLSRKDKEPGRQKKKRRTETEHSSDRYPSKRRVEDARINPVPAEVPLGLSEEEVFKQKHASEFDESIREPPFGHVKIKSEPLENSDLESETLPSPIPTSGSATANVGQVTSTALNGTTKNGFEQECRSAKDRQSVLDTILSSQFGPEMTQPAINQVLQDAQDSAKRDNELGLAYIQAQIDRLRQKGTSLPRLTEVILSLQDGLRDLTRQLSTRIDSLGELTATSVNASNDVARHHVDTRKRRHPSSDSSDRDAQPTAEISRAEEFRSATDSGTQHVTVEASPCGSESSTSSSDDTETSSRGLLSGLKANSQTVSARPTAIKPYQASGKSGQAEPSRLMVKRCENKRPRTITTLFPYLTQATSLTPNDQPCYVPFASRGVERNRGCLFVINTPDTNTGKLTTNLHVLTACHEQHLVGLIEVARCNNNIVSATFASYNNARMTRDFVSINLPSTTGNKTVTIKAEFHLSRAPKFFSCDASSLEIEHDTVAAVVSKALRGRKGCITREECSAPYKLLRQETHDAQDDRLRYLLRFDDGARAPGVQCFYIPLDAESGSGKIWGIFRPDNRQAECVFCGAICQLGRDSTCHFTTVIGSQNGPEP